MTYIHHRKKRLPKSREPVSVEMKDLLPHELRKQELSELHGIPVKDIFVDRKNGVELYRTTNDTWVSNPIYREVN